ncbi:hypothetical protein [Klebsiella quasipneumoniae]|uniref:hypothetical protein n=1 Tax=Klebsiella quasipneumoniae TaxID=1463165 RepID=UPI003967538B
MSEYDTGNPVPSASIPDAWDNMQSIDRFANSSDETITTRTGKQLDTLHGINVKADSQRTEQQDSFELSQSERASSFEEKTNEFESRFSSQLSTQESTFSESQTDKENRFQQFLLSSGYQFLGDYENGPYVFSELNQYIEYSGNSYRIASASDIGFTTTGTDATSFANDVTHFVLMDGDTLRQNLASNDGLKWIGKCKSVQALRTIEPTISGQSIILERAVVGGPLLNVIITHNPAPSDAVDDGYSRFVTAGGAVWDADISFGHNVFLAGYSDALNNLADCLNMIIQDKVNKVISRGYVVGGVDAEIRIPPNPNAENATVFYMNKKSVKIPSFLKVHSAPGAIYDYSDFTTGVGIIGSNEFEGLTNSLMFLDNGGGWGTGAGASNSHNTGGFIGNGCLIKGPNTTSNPNATTYPGVRWGNVTYPSGNYAHFRDTTFSDARVSGWGSGFRPGSVDTYLMDVVACHFTNNTYGIDTYTAWSGSTPQWANSGEKMSFRGCLIGNNRSHAVYLDNRGDFFYFDMCSIDYNGGDVFHCSPTNLGEVNYINGHIEGNSGLILNCPTRTTNDGENNVKIRGAKIYPNKSTNDKYGGVRDIVFGTTIRTILELDSCNIFCRAPYVNGAYPTWKGYNPANLARLIIKYPGSGQTYRFLPSYDGTYGYRINNTLLFSGTENENVPTSRTGDFWCIKSGGASCVYGGAGDADSDGVIPIKITLNSPTDTVQLLFSRQITPERGTQHIHGFCSIKAAAFAGALNVSAIARTIASVTRTVTAAPGPVTETENLYGVNQSISQDILTSLANPTISITKDDYMGTRPLAVQLIGGNYSYLGFLFTGGVGTFYVKLPVWANLDSHPTIGYQ